MLIVKKGKNDSIDVMLKKLKNKVRKTKQTDELRNRQQFDKPSVKKRKQKLKAIYVEQKYGDHNEC